MPNLYDLMQSEVTRAARATEAYRALTFIKVTPGTRNAGARTSGTQPTAVNYSCLGSMTGYDDSDINGEVIKDGDRRVTILASSLVMPSGTLPPTSGDRVIGDDGRTYEVIGASRTPAGSLYILHARG